MLEKLSKLKTIPAVVAKEDLINKMRGAEYIFDDFSLERCESVREDLRDLMQYIPDGKRFYVIDTRDFIIETGGGDVKKEKTYAEKANE